MDVLTKKQMSEEDIKLHDITPALTAKWSKGKITMETQVTDGRIDLSREGQKPATGVRLRCEH